jgi:hypothetical protein
MNETIQRMPGSVEFTGTGAEGEHRRKMRL